MEAKELLEAAKAQALKDLEVLLKNQVAVAYDAAIAMAAGKVKEAIPGQADDVIIDVVVASLKPVLKELLLQQIEKVAA